MSNTTSDRRFAARVFAVSGGALLGLGFAFLQALYLILKQPVENPGISIIAMFLFVAGILATLGGGGLAFTSFVVRGPHRVGHLVGWVLVPALLAFGLCWAVIVAIAPHL